MSTLPLFEPQFTPDLNGTHLAVAILLQDNRGRWLKSRHIAERVSLRNSADVRHIIQELIDDYHLEIIGDRKAGFRFSHSRAEFEDHQAANLSQAVTTFNRVRARLGERKFRALLVKLKISEAFSLEQEAATLALPEATR